VSSKEKELDVTEGDVWIPGRAQTVVDLLHDVRTAHREQLDELEALAERLSSPYDERIRRAHATIKEHVESRLHTKIAQAEMTAELEVLEGVCETEGWLVGLARTWILVLLDDTTDEHEGWFDLAARLEQELEIDHERAPPLLLTSDEVRADEPEPSTSGASKEGMLSTFRRLWRRGA
jgi:hypothetical protein